MKRILSAAFLLAVAVPIVVSAADIDPHFIKVEAADIGSPEARLDYYRTAARNFPGRTSQNVWNIALHLANANGEPTLVNADQLVAGQHLSYEPALIPGATTSTTSPASSTSSVPTTLAPSTTLSPTTTSTASSTTTTTLPPSSSTVHALGVGAVLPSEAMCAARVIPMTENRAATNSTANATRGSSPNDVSPRVTGNFVGTTDEIIQWAACKWGLNVDWARSQAALESWWQMDTLGDWGTDPAGCSPGHTLGSDGTPGQCPQSVGLLQTRWLYMKHAFEDNNAERSTAYNADVTWGLWRECFDGQGGFPDYFWLNTVERGADYAYGDGLGCMGTWFAGRWRTDAALGYMQRVTQYHDDPGGGPNARGVWNTPGFPPAVPRGTPPSTSTTVPAVSTTIGATSSSTSTTTPPNPSQPGAWQQIAPPGPTMDPNFHHQNGNYGFQSIAISPDGNTLYVTADYQGLYRSTNRGASWTRVSAASSGVDLESGTPWTLQVDPFNPQILWANAGYGDGGPLRSTDGGVTWTRLAVPGAGTDTYSIAMDRNLQGHVLVAWHTAWAGGSSGISETFNSGQTWVNHPAAGNWGSGHAVFFLNNSATWLVGTQSDGIWRTTNSGASWVQVSQWSITHGATGFLTKVGTTLFIAHSNRVSRSVDNGATWTDITQGLPQFSSFSAIASDGVNLYTAPSFPWSGGYPAAEGPWYVRPVTGGTWTALAGSPNPCYRGGCNGPRQVASVGGYVYTSNYSGGIWRLNP